jgi:hypothetical protein
MVGAAGEMGFVSRFVRGRFGRRFLRRIFVVFFDCLISLLFDRFRIGQIEEVSDGRLYASEIRWVGASVD